MKTEKAVITSNSVIAKMMIASCPLKCTGRVEISQDAAGLHHLELGALDLGHVEHEVYQPVAVAPLVVVPGHHLHERGVEHDTRLGVEH